MATRIEVPLEELASSSRGIRGCLLATVDGVAIAEKNCSQHAEPLAALAASALGIGRKVTDVGDCGTLEEVCFKGYEGWVSVCAVGSKAVLAITAHEGASIGMVMYHARKCVDAVLELIDPEQAKRREEREEARYEDQFSMRSALSALAAIDREMEQPSHEEASVER